MSYYSIHPAIKLRRESWGGLVLTPSGKLTLIGRPEIFDVLENFQSAELDENNLPPVMAELIQAGLIIQVEQV